MTLFGTRREAFMAQNSSDFTRKLLLWGGPIVGAHFLVVL